MSRSIKDFQSWYPKLLLFEYMYMLLTSTVIIPVISFIFNRILIVVGSGILLNDEVYRLGLTYEGAFGLMVIGFVAAFALFIELCVLIILIQQRYFGKKIAIVDAFLTVLRQTPRLFGFGMFQLFVILLILIPFIDSPLSSSFYALFNFPIFVQNQVLEVSYVMTFVYILLLIVAVYIVLRGIFVLHFIVLEGKSTLEAIRSSLVLTRGRRIKLFFSLFVFNGAILGTGFVFISFISYMPSWLDLNVLRLFTNHYSLTLSTIVTYMFALLLMPINLIFLTRLFYSFKRTKGAKPQNKLRVYHSKVGRMEQRAISFVQRKVRPRWLYAVIALVYVGLVIFVGIKASDSLVYAKWNVIISAHRGDMENAPENSMPAITSAIEKGIQSVELDVQLTKDGVVVLFHDYTLQRMTGVPVRVSDVTYEELRTYAIGWNENGESIHIPMLSEALTVANGQIKLLLDLKAYENGDELAREVVTLVRAYNMVEQVYIQSFDSQLLRLIRDHAPEIVLGQILYLAVGDLTALDVDFYTIEQTMLTEQLVERAHAAGREIWVWTVNSRHNLKEVLKYNVDGIISDHPVLAQSLVEIR